MCEGASGKTVRMFSVECPHCGVSMSIDEKYIGKKGRCNKCKQVFTVPQQGGGTPASAKPSPPPAAASSGGTPSPVAANLSPFPFPFGEPMDAAEPAQEPQAESWNFDNPFGGAASPPSPGGAPFDDFAGTPEPIEASPEAGDRQGSSTSANDESVAAAPTSSAPPPPVSEGMTELPFEMEDAAVGDHAASAGPSDFSFTKLLGGAPATPSASMPTPVASKGSSHPKPPDADIGSSVADLFSGAGSTKQADIPAEPSRMSGNPFDTPHPSPARNTHANAAPASPAPVRAVPAGPGPAQVMKRETRPVSSSSPAAPQPASPVPPSGPATPARTGPVPTPPSTPSTPSSTSAAAGAVNLSGMKLAKPLGRAASVDAIRIEGVEFFNVQMPTKTADVQSLRLDLNANMPANRLFLKLIGSGGAYGWGEMVVCPRRHAVAADGLALALRRLVAPAVAGVPAWNRRQVHRQLEKVLAASSVRQLISAAFDMALLDLTARAAGMTIAAMLGGRRRSEVWLAYGVAAPSAEGAIAQMQRGLSQGFTAFKVKLGHLHEPIARTVAQAICEAAPKGTFFWMDAWPGLSWDAARRMTTFLSRLGGHVLEHPLARGDDALARLAAVQGIPLALGGTQTTPERLIETLGSRSIDFAILSPLVGGYDAARGMATMAEAAGIRTLIAADGASDVAAVHGLHLASYLGVDLPVDLNGRQYLESRFVTSTFEVRHGRAFVPERPGSGIEIDENQLRSLSSN